MKLTGDNLSIYDVYAIAVHHMAVQLDEDKLNKVKETFNRVQEWGMARHPMYGVNTGFGELIHIVIPPQFKSELQSNLLRSHAAGAGEPFSDEIVRAIMTVRLNYLMKGFSGVSAEAVELLQQFLNRHIYPIIPQQGSLGASGDLAPLSHMALPLIGEGSVRIRGHVCSAAEALQEEGLKPLELGFKEALALVNGTSAMTGVASITLVRVYRLLKLAVVATADLLQCLGCSVRPFDSRGHELKNHAGQITIARNLRHLLSGSKRTRDHSDIMRSISERVTYSDEVVSTNIYLQNAYSLRCIPQILGPVLDTLDFCRKIVEEEVNSCNDNPLLFETPEEVFHGGNFHGQYVAMASDFINIALTEIGVLAERQLNRLLDPHLNNNLPPFLAKGQTGLFCGFEGGQYLATSIAAENLDLAAPSSIKSLPSNGSNQDIVSMGLTSARKSLQLCTNVTTILVVLVAACHQATHFMELEEFSPPIKELHQELSGIVSEYHDAIPLNEVFSKVRTFLETEQFLAYLDQYVDLSRG